MIGSLSATPALVIKEYGFIYRVMVYPIVPLMGGAFLVFIDDFDRGLVRLKVSLGFGILQQMLVEDVDYL